MMLNERDPNDKTPFPSIEHDLTVEQRKERNEMVVIAKEEQNNQPEGSHFRIRVRGPSDAMMIVKIDTRTGKWDTLEKKQEQASKLNMMSREGHSVGSVRRRLTRLSSE